MSGLKEQGDLFWTLTHQDTQSGIFDKFFFLKKLLPSDRLQLIAICCNRRGVCTEHLHTSHFLVFHSTHFNVARDIGSRCLARTSSMYHPNGAVVLILFDSPLCTLHRLSHLPFHSPDLHLHLPCGLVRWESRCARPRMRS